ncbi:hypothetical protein L1987_88508 [Smallanthus sonchifolius]|nr:hypothetical protein L1987_88508 [Smallanthus sonchifolius]
MKRRGTMHSSRAGLSRVRSDQPATGLRNKELSKGQEIDERNWPNYSYSMDMLAFGMKMDEQALEPGTDEIRGKHGTGHYTGGET